MTFLANANFEIWPLYSDQEMREPEAGDIVQMLTGNDLYEVRKDGLYHIADGDGDLEPVKVPFQLRW